MDSSIATLTLSDRDLLWHSVNDISVTGASIALDASEDSPSITHRSHSSMAERKSHYLGELVWQVDEIVYCGGLEAVQNQNLLCRLGIEYIVDLSGQDDDPNLALKCR